MTYFILVITHPNVEAGEDRKGLPIMIELINSLINLILTFNSFISQLINSLLFAFRVRAEKRIRST